MARRPGRAHQEVRLSATNRDAEGAHAEQVQDAWEQINTKSGTSLKVGIVIGAKEIAEIQAMRQESLRHMADTKEQAAVVASVS